MRSGPRATSLFGLAPGGACHAVDVAADAVGSYPTLSPLPPANGRRFAFCGAIPRVAPGGSYPPPLHRGARTFLDRRRARRDRPAVWRGSRCAARRMRSTSDAIRTQRPYVAPMSDPAVRSAPHESEEQRARRLAWERERLAEAEKDIAAGRVISGGAALDWLDRWAAGEDLDEPDLH